jgi:hypothetical protein
MAGTRYGLLMTVRSAVVRMIGPAVLTLLAGCGAANASGPRSTAERWVSGLRDGDGAALCGLLAPKTLASAEQSAGKPCSDAILDEKLPQPNSVGSTQVWGDTATVRLDADTLFLAEFSSGWKVIAAGCDPRPGQPYDCQVEGG